MSSNPEFTLSEPVSAAAAVRLYALHVLTTEGGDRPAAAKALDVDPSTLRKWLRDMVEQGIAIPASPHRQGRGRKAIAVTFPAKVDEGI